MAYTDQRDAPDNVSYAGELPQRRGIIIYGPGGDFASLDDTALGESAVELIDADFFGAQQAGSHSITATGIASSGGVGSVGLNGQIACLGVASVAALGAPGLNGQIGAAGFSQASGLGQPEIRARLDASGVPSAEVLGTVSLNGTIAAGGVAAAEAVGIAAVSAQLSPVGVQPTTEGGTPALNGSIAPVALYDYGGFGQPVVTPVPLQQPSQGFGFGVRRARAKVPGRLSARGVENLSALGRPLFQPIAEPRRQEPALAASYEEPQRFFPRQSASVHVLVVRGAFEGSASGRPAVTPAKSADDDDLLLLLAA